MPLPWRKNSQTTATRVKHPPGRWSTRGLDPSIAWAHREMALTDIEDHKREALRVGEKRLLEMIATGGALEDILIALSLMIEEQRSGTLASVLLLNPDGVHLDFVAGPSLPDEWRQQMAKLPIGPCAGSCGTAAFRGSPVIVSDIKTDPLWEVPEHRASALKHGLRASWSNPVLSSKGKVLGTFCMYYREPRSPSSHDLELIGSATHFVRMASKRDRAEEALRRNEQLLRDVIDTIPIITWSMLPNGANDFTSRYWLEYTGVSTEDSLGDGWRTAFHPADIAEHVEKWAASLATGKPFENEARVQRVDGEYRWFLHRGVPLRDVNGTILKWYGTAIDIEDRKRAEEERLRLRQLEGDLAHLNRVSMMGELAASLAHDIKQPLTGAVMSADACVRWLRRDPPDMTEAYEAASRIVSNVTRAAEIIDRVQALFKRGAPERELVDVNDIAREMIALLRHTANRNSISIRTELDAGLPATAADRVQLQQVLMNLMLNGIEAMKDAGGELILTSSRTEEGHILISVSDSGIGLPAHEAERIYEAFSRTSAEGTGMGLSISRRIIESHGGRLWASNKFSLPINVTGS